MIRKHCQGALSFAAVMMSLLAFADNAAATAAKRFAAGGDVTSFHYTDSSGVGYTAFVHTFTNTAGAVEFKNRSGKKLPVRLLVVGGGGAGMDGLRVPLSSTSRRSGGGGGGGGGVTETNAFLSAGDVWTIRVGAGGTVPSSHSQSAARGEAGASSVSNELLHVQLVNAPGGGAGGSKEDGLQPTVGASGGGGSGNNPAQAAGAEGNYTNSVGGVPYGPYSGGNGGATWTLAYGGGGGGAGANGNGAAGGEGLANDITGVSVVYGSGGGGGGHSRLNFSGQEHHHDGGAGGTNAGNGGTCDWDIVDDGATTNIVVTAATAPVANTGAGGAGGVSFGGGANFSEYEKDYTYATPGADGVVIIRYDIPDTPCVGGDVVTVTTNGLRVTYIHKFTNTTETATFKPSVAFDGANVRLLVVGGGGAGMDGIRNHNVTSAARYGGGGGGGGGVTETNAFLSVDDVWTIRVGAGGTIPSHSPSDDRGEAGASSVSNATVELVLTPGGGAGGARNTICATEGAAGGGGTGREDVYKFGANGTYLSFTFKLVDGIPIGPFGGGDSSGDSSHGVAGGGGGAGENGKPGEGGSGLVSDITGSDVMYGAGGGGGGMVRVYNNSRQGAVNGGKGGDGAGSGGQCSLDIVNDGSVTNIYLTSATPPAPNRGGGGAGGASFNDQGDALYADGVLVDDRNKTAVHYATSGADGVVIIRYEADLPHPRGFVVIIN